MCIYIYINRILGALGSRIFKVFRRVNCGLPMAELIVIIITINTNYNNHSSNDNNTNNNTTTTTTTTFKSRKS